MNLNNALATVSTKISVWTAQNPVAARAIMLTVPFVAAAILALATQQSAFACPGPVGSGCGGG